MGDKELQLIVSDLRQLLLNQTNSGCSASQQIVQEHTIKLGKIESDISHVLHGITEINKKLETQQENHNENTDKIQAVDNRLIKLEENKKNIITTVCLIAVVAYEIGKEWLFKKI